MTHGTLTGYVQHKCRCDECSLAMRRYNKRRRYLVAQGQDLTVDAAEVHDHVRRLMERGMSFKAVATAAGYRSRNSLTCVLKAKRVRKATAQRILAVTPDSDTRAGTYVDATGARRRLQALAAMGWPTAKLAHKLGRKDDTTLLEIRRGALTSIRRSTHQDVCALYDELWNRTGPSERTRSKAVRDGWASPLAWEDDTIDDPEAVPVGHSDGAARRSRDDLVEDYLDTFEHHQGDLLVASERLGVTHLALTQLMYRLRREGVDIAFHHVDKH